MVASGISTSKIRITWNDVATTENRYELFRSNNTNANYILVATLAANSATYTDSALFANAIYYYKVKAVSTSAGPSAYSNEDSALTGNNPPVITDLTSRTARYGVTTTIAVTASDENGRWVIIQNSERPCLCNIYR
ncbi:MAG: hypothetical protein WDN26_00085 [Chitinophagaceae bacterium]